MQIFGGLKVQKNAQYRKLDDTITQKLIQKHKKCGKMRARLRMWKKFCTFARNLCN